MLSTKELTISFLQKHPNQQLTAREIAEHILNENPEWATLRRNNSLQFFATTEDFVRQIASEIRINSWKNSDDNAVDYGPLKEDTSTIPARIWWSFTEAPTTPQEPQVADSSQTYEEGREEEGHQHLTPTTSQMQEENLHEKIAEDYEPITENEDDTATEFDDEEERSKDEPDEEELTLEDDDTDVVDEGETEQTSAESETVIPIMALLVKGKNGLQVSLPRNTSSLKVCFPSQLLENFETRTLKDEESLKTLITILSAKSDDEDALNNYQNMPTFTYTSKYNLTVQCKPITQYEDDKRVMMLAGSELTMIVNPKYKSEKPKWLRDWKKITGNKNLAKKMKGYYETQKDILVSSPSALLSLSVGSNRSGNELVMEGRNITLDDWKKSSSIRT